MCTFPYITIFSMFPELDERQCIVFVCMCVRVCVCARVCMYGCL